MTVVNAPLPTVETVPGEDTKHAHPYAHIVVALDGSLLSEQVLTYVEPLAKVFGSALICVCAVEPVKPSAIAEASLGFGYEPLGPLLETKQEIETQDRAYLAEIKERLSEKGFTVRCEEPKANAAEAILESACRNQADLIAIATHGRSRLGRVLLGSVADEVVRGASCPVLVIRQIENQTQEPS